MKNYFSIPGITNPPPPKLTNSEVCDLFCRKTLARMEDIAVKSRTRNRVKYRYTLAYFLHRYTTDTLHQIAKTVGLADHTGALHAIDTVKVWMDFEDGFRSFLSDSDPVSGIQATVPPLFTTARQYQRCRVNPPGRKKKVPMVRPAALVSTTEQIMQKYGV